MTENNGVDHSQMGRQGLAVTAVIRWTAGLYILSIAAASLLWLSWVSQHPEVNEILASVAVFFAILTAVLTGSLALAFAELVDSVVSWVRSRRPESGDAPSAPDPRPQPTR